MIVTDLDGTLLRSDLTISERTVKAFAACKAKGIYTAFATARTEDAAEKYISCIKPDIIISNGGALVTVGGKTVLKKMMSAEAVRKIIDMCMPYGGSITLEAEDGYYFNHAPSKLTESLSKAIFTDFADFYAPAYKVTAELDAFELARQICMEVGNVETLSFRGEKWRRFAAKGADKVAAVKALAEYLEIDISDIVAFGDDYNDIDMLKAVGTGVAMGNALDEVKEAADCVALDNDSDGVAEFIERYMLKEEENND